MSCRRVILTTIINIKLLFHVMSKLVLFIMLHGIISSILYCNRTRATSFRFILNYSVSDHVVISIGLETSSARPTRGQAYRLLGVPLVNLP